MLLLRRSSLEIIVCAGNEITPDRPEVSTEMFRALRKLKFCIWRRFAFKSCEMRLCDGLINCEYVMIVTGCLA